MKTLEQWLDAYGESHQNPVNIRIHKIAVPGIYLSVTGLLWSIPQLTLLGITLNWALVALVPVLIFYARLSVSIMLVMAALSGICIGLVAVLDQNGNPVPEWSLGLFIALWAAQFIGHKIEGKKPSFFDDVKFLLIGPVWVFRNFSSRKQS